MQSPLALLCLLKEDLATHGSDWTKPGFQTLALYRIGRWTTTIETKAVRTPLYKLARVGHVFCRNFYGIELPFEACVGRRVTLEHQHGIVVHGNSVIGDDCTLRQGCTLGIRDVNKPWEAPELSAGVDVGCGAAILGPVWIGKGAKIGANSVVVKDVLPRTTVVGVPARPVTKRSMDIDLSPLPWTDEDERMVSQ